MKQYLFSGIAVFMAICLFSFTKSVKKKDKALTYFFQFAGNPFSNSSVKDPSNWYSIDEVDYDECLELNQKACAIEVWSTAVTGSSPVILKSTAIINTLQYSGQGLTTYYVTTTGDVIAATNTQY